LIFGTLGSKQKGHGKPTNTITTVLVPVRSLPVKPVFGTKYKHTSSHHDEDSLPGIAPRHCTITHKMKNDHDHETTTTTTKETTETS
jgi:hypothetical protein